MSARRTRRVLAASAVLGLGGASLMLTISPADAAPVTETFDFTGAAEDFVVPEGVCEVTVDAYGAEGGVAESGSSGGLGGRATADLAVTPGETLVVVVGGQGGSAADPSSAPVPGIEGNPAGSGGFNGGGIGGDNVPDPGGGGGGASDVRQGGADLDDRVVVAGGGGGSGADTLGPAVAAGTEGVADAGSGGHGGGTDGVDGADSGGGSDAGDGGTQTAGGAGSTTDSTATDGSLGQGGVGGIGNDDDDGGGGGGGGYYGGGGGGGSIFVPVPSPGTGGTEGSGTNFGAGGGGGSGFGPAGVAFETGVRDSDGLVTITYDADAETCGPDVDPDEELPDVVEAAPAFTG